MASESYKRAVSLLRRKLIDLEQRGGERLAALVASPERERIVEPSGRSFWVNATAFWDAAPGDSDLYVEVVVSPGRDLLGRKCKSGLVVDPYTHEIVRYGNFPKE